MEIDDRQVALANFRKNMHKRVFSRSPGRLMSLEVSRIAGRAINVQRMYNKSQLVRNNFEYKLSGGSAKNRLLRFRLKL